MSVLPNQILPPNVQWMNSDGTPTKDFYLLMYNLAQQVLGNSNSSAAAVAAFINADMDADIDTTDALSLVRRVTNLENQIDIVGHTDLLSLAQRVSNLESQLIEAPPTMGATATITTAKLASATGSMTFQQGLLISEVQAT